MALIGNYEGKVHEALYGWAWDEGASKPAELEIIVDGQIHYPLTPDIVREDLFAHGLGDGGCAFYWLFPDELYDGEPHQIEIRMRATGEPLPGQADRIVFQADNYRHLPPTSPGFDRSDMQRRIAEVSWFHSFDFGDGLVADGSKGLKRLEFEAAAILPKDIAGKSCLDIGAWDGFFSFQAEHRGARSVLATDHFSWSGAGWGTADGFRLARELIDSDVSDMDIDALDIEESMVGRHDVVLFLGVLYHLQNPFAGLRAAASVCDDTLIVETTLHLHEVEAPSMRFFAGSELGGDPTNWWSPNPRCVTEMLEVLGFDRIIYTPHPSEVDSSAPSRGIFHALR